MSECTHLILPATQLCKKHPTTSLPALAQADFVYRAPTVCQAVYQRITHNLRALQT